MARLRTLSAREPAWKKPVDVYIRLRPSPLCGRDRPRGVDCRVVPYRGGSRCSSVPPSPAVRRSPSLLLAIAVVQAADYEPLPTFKASAILPAKQVKGPLFTVSETVKNDGFLNDFHITTPEFGNYHVQGKTMLLVRLQEIAALGELQKVSKSEVFLKSAGTAVVNVGKGVGQAVTDPVDTVKGVGAGSSASG